MRKTLERKIDSQSERERVNICVQSAPTVERERERERKAKVARWIGQTDRKSAFINTTSIPFSPSLTKPFTPINVRSFRFLSLSYLLCLKQCYYAFLSLTVSIHLPSASFTFSFSLCPSVCLSVCVFLTYKHSWVVVRAYK